MAQKTHHEAIRINQVAMYPGQEKVAVIENGRIGQPFAIKDAKGRTVYTGKVKRVATSQWSGKKRAIADFSGVRTVGTYTFSRPTVIMCRSPSAHMPWTRLPRAFCRLIITSGPEYQ